MCGYGRALVEVVESDVGGHTNNGSSAFSQDPITQQSMDLTPTLYLYYEQLSMLPAKVTTSIYRYTVIFRKDLR